MRKVLYIGGLVAALGLAIVFLVPTSESPPEQGAAETSAALEANGPRGHLLSAFFGLDNSLPFGANRLCMGASGKDGMPVVLSAVVDPETLQAEDFRVITSSGSESTPHCVTLRPASDAGELRTVLMIGEFGDAGDDPPMQVRVVGDLLSAGKVDEQVNFRGAEVQVTPLEAGPTLVSAEVVPDEIWSMESRGSACPANSRQVLRVTWAGGVRLPGGDEPGDAERVLYRVIVTHPDGTSEELTPAALADLGDNDNNHLLCLDSTAAAMAVTFPGGHLVDPNGDLNAESRIAVTGGSRRS